MKARIRNVIILIFFTLWTFWAAETAGRVYAGGSGGVTEAMAAGLDTITDARPGGAGRTEGSVSAGDNTYADGPQSSVSVSDRSPADTPDTPVEEGCVAGGSAGLCQGISLEDTLPEGALPAYTKAGQDEPEPEGNEYADLAIADVDHYVNVRETPGTDGKIVGKIYHGAVAQVLAVAGEKKDWFQIISGSVEGYIKAEFFIYGEAAAEVIDDYVTRYAQVQARRLNIRKEPAVDGSRIGYVDRGERLKILEDCGEWLRVQYTEQKEGYAAAEYVLVAEEFTYAKSIEEEREELAAQKELEERQKAAEQAAAGQTGTKAGGNEAEAPETGGTENTENTENTGNEDLDMGDIQPPAGAYASMEELRGAIVDYAMQYKGNRYVHGGRSLAGGTDCSGFTSFIYADFGYSISRTPSGQYSSSGRSIAYEEIQPGDIICYTSNGKKCTHVGLYIGDGQIIHSANPRKGVIISAADYDTILDIKNVLD